MKGDIFETAKQGLFTACVLLVDQTRPNWYDTEYAKHNTTFEAIDDAYTGAQAGNNFKIICFYHDEWAFIQRFNCNDCAQVLPRPCKAHSRHTDECECDSAKTVYVKSHGEECPGHRISCNFGKTE